MTTKDLINKTVKYLKQYAPKYNVSVYSPILAQLLLESAKGTSELAVKANNYFGLKYKKGRCPTATGIYEKYGSEQLTDGSYQYSRMQWCKFKDLDGCIVGYLDFINNSRYSNLKNVTDPKEYLEKIKADGYATSLDYVSNLLQVINTYNLTEYDPKRRKYMAYKIAIDAGHGSNTAGKRTPDGWREHWTNVMCANYFDIAMKRCGFETLKTGWNDTNSKDDADVSLSTRQKQIKNSKCDISVSWHANAYGDGKSFNSAQGIETLIHNNNSKAKDSENLATKVQNHLTKGTKQQDRKVKAASLAMCNCTAMGTKASILIEIGFMTNKYEAELIRNDSFCLECAEEAAQGVCEYLGVNYIKPNGESNISSTVPSIPTTPSSSIKYTYNGLDYSPVFDPTYYANNNSDVKKVFGTNANKLFNHFKTYGMNEGRQATSTFNVIVYKNKYADLQKAFGDNLPEYYKHYIQYGKKENRQGV